jgi:hypothetical protein
MMRTVKSWLGMGPIVFTSRGQSLCRHGREHTLNHVPTRPGISPDYWEAYIHGIMHGEAVSEFIKTTEVHLGNETDNWIIAVLLFGS